MKKLFIVGLILVSGIGFAGSGGKGDLDMGSYSPKAIASR